MLSAMYNDGRAACRKSAQPVPASSQLGFLRFLQLLASHPWALQPLVVDPATAMTDGDVHGAYATYRARKAEGPVPACYLVTPYDRKSAVWSGESPAPEILIRAAQLAGTSLAALTGALGSQSFVSKCVSPPTICTAQCSVTRHACNGQQNCPFRPAVSFCCSFRLPWPVLLSAAAHRQVRLWGVRIHPTD